jgi:transposase
MSVPIPLRRDFGAARLRGLAKKAKDGPQARRLLTLAAIYDGATRTEAAKIGGVGLQIIRDWVLRFNARGPDGLLDDKPPGQPSKLNDGQRQAIAQMIESGPIRRRTRVVGAFPDGQSCLNLAAARLRYIAGTAWSTKRYMNMRPLYQPQIMQTGAVA